MPLFQDLSVSKSFLVGRLSGFGPASIKSPYYVRCVKVAILLTFKLARAVFMIRVMYSKPSTHLLASHKKHTPRAHTIIRHAAATKSEAAFNNISLGDQLG